MKGRHYKFFKFVDYHTEKLKKEYDDGIIGVDEFNEREQEIYDDAEEFLGQGFFKIIELDPDTEKDEDEDFCRDYSN